MPACKEHGDSAQVVERHEYAQKHKGDRNRAHCLRRRAVVEDRETDEGQVASERGLDESARTSSGNTQSGGGRVVTTETADLAIVSPFGTNWEFKDANFRLIFDVDKLSKPKEPPEMADSVMVPENIDVENEIPTGIMCGVQPISSLENTPIDMLITFYCCKADGSPFIPCGPEQEECDSMADIVANGCNLCTSVTLAEAIIGVANGTLTAIDLTAECTPGCQGIPLTLGIEPDVDLDGDGTNDGYTTVMAFEGMRIHPRGMAEESTE